MKQQGKEPQETRNVDDSAGFSFSFSRNGEEEEGTLAVFDWQRVNESEHEAVQDESE